MEGSMRNTYWGTMLAGCGHIRKSELPAGVCQVLYRSHSINKEMRAHALVLLLLVQGEWIDYILFTTDRL